MSTSSCMMALGGRRVGYSSRTKSVYRVQGTFTRLYNNKNNNMVSFGLPFGVEDIQVDVGVMLEGKYEDDETGLVDVLYDDAVKVTKEAVCEVMLGRVRGGEDVEVPRPLELSLVLCDDEYIRGLNREWRNVDAATDVLAFEMDDDVVLEYEQPVVVLGDVVISLDTAQRQAEERGHSLLDECRILLIHGVLHLLGYDHEDGEDEAREMHDAEIAVLKRLGYDSVDSGLIGFSKNGYGTRTKRDVKVVCVDMDGTLLDSSSSVLPSSVDAIRMAMDRGVKVILATGKARPAAVKAMEKVGLAGDGLVVGQKTPGIFLQGLQVYGHGGRALQGVSLDKDIAERVLMYAYENDISITCFLGDECVTPKMTKELEELHYRYYEPYAQVMSIQDIVRGPAIRKMLLMHDPDHIRRFIRPQMDVELEATDACTMQAVETMLEIVPRGVNKWTALQLLVQDFDGFGGIDNVMAIGDGENDLEMIKGAGIGVAMGNAVPAVKQAADFVVASNDDDGIAEAIHTFLN